jgi:predicted SprT family Zn-dependent metalloprotease
LNSTNPEQKVVSDADTASILAQLAPLTMLPIDTSEIHDLVLDMEQMAVSPASPVPVVSEFEDTTAELLSDHFSAEDAAVDPYMYEEAAEGGYDLNDSFLANEDSFDYLEDEGFEGEQSPEKQQQQQQHPLLNHLAAGMALVRGEERRVQSIADKRMIRGGQIQYLVHWAVMEGKIDLESCWVDAEAMNNRDKDAFQFSPTFTAQHSPNNHGVISLLQSPVPGMPSPQPASASVPLSLLSDSCSSSEEEEELEPVIKRNKTQRKKRTLTAALEELEVSEDADQQTVLSPLPINTPERLMGPPLQQQSKEQTFRQFKQTRDAQTAELFDDFDLTVFEHRLTIADVTVTWNKNLNTTAGLTRLRRVGPKYKATIELSTKVVDNTHKLRQTLMHEMCHAATWVFDHIAKPPHGLEFKRWAGEAGAAYDDIDVTTCHNYEVHYKYKYACTFCDKTFGRHSKSLNCQKYRCAACSSKIALVGAFNKDGTPMKQRKPNKFALFVKQEFAAVKAANPNVKHQAIMQLISAKYKATTTAG